MTTFTSLDNLLKKIHAATGAAEAHGIICGHICATGHHGPHNDWLDIIFGVAQPVDDAPEECLSKLLSLYQTSLHQIQAMDFDFRCLLPDDPAPLSYRAKSLSQWCQGFLAGLGLNKIDIDQGKSEESRDALLHISEFAQLDYANLDVHDENDEKAYSEIYEYVRMAVLMIYTELHGRTGIVTTDEIKRIH